VKGARRSRSRRLPAVLLPGLVLLLFALVGLKAAGVGPDLPGPRIFGGDPYTPVTCSPTPRRLKDPSSPRPAPGSWTRAPQTPEPAAELSGGTLGGLAYLVGGQDPIGKSIATVRTFDPATGRYGQVPDMPLRTDHVIAKGYRGNLYVVAGYHDSEPAAALMSYSPSERRWTMLARPPLARGGAGGAVIGHRLYVVGGAPRSSPNAHVKPYRMLAYYDFRTGRWGEGPPMPTARHHIGVAALGSSLFVAGGRTPADLSTNAFESYDTRTRRWSKLPHMPLGVAAAGMVTGSHEVIVGGGDDETNWQTGGGWATNSSWAYNPGTRRWRRLPDLPHAVQAAAVVAVGGRIRTFAGNDCPGLHRTREAFSLATP
jgi:N-acetylneuraminic acid mutarotase